MRQHPTLIVFGVSALAVFGALAWVTHHALSLERQQMQARVDAQVQEKVRLALWRMDSKASVLLAREAARPYFEYQPFYAMDRAYTRMLEEVRPGEVLVPSPLLAGLDQTVKLYFQVDSHGVVTSPQAPAGNLRDLAEASYVSSQSVIDAESRLEQLQRLIQPELRRVTGNIRGGGRKFDGARDDLVGLLSGSAGFGAGPLAPGAESDVPMPEAGMNFQMSPDNKPAPTPNPEPTQPAPSQTAERQTVDQSLNEYRARVSAAEAVKDAVQTQNQSGGKSYSRNAGAGASQQPAAPAAAVPAARPGRAAPEREGSDREELALKEDMARKQAAQESTPAPPAPAEKVAQTEAASATDDKGSASADANVEYKKSGEQIARTLTKQEPLSPASIGVQINAVTPDAAFGIDADTHQILDAEEAGVVISSFAARWLFPTEAPLGGSNSGSQPELFLIRQVRLGESVMEQGCWLDWPLLRGDLLASVRDLLPNADIVPVTPIMNEGGENLARRLASVPAELIPGNVATASMVPNIWTSWTPLHNTLLLAWAGVLLAIAAIAYLLRAATDLAERRGRFVSAVTHELRTPLTTFVMYSQMLADGMVPEGEARQHYYSTLKREAGRLAGIVENVLEFARLSRKKRTRAAATASGPIRAGELLERLAVPLRQRVEQCGKTLNAAMDGPEESAGELVTTEELTIERILFNLVDNACKYGTQGEGIVTLRVRVEGSGVVFTVSDDGPGISAIDRPRIFKAFERGEKQGDGSIPGLGLGLALSRGLARDLGGELSLVSASPAVFELRVPRH